MSTLETRAPNSPSATASRGRFGRPMSSRAITLSATVMIMSAAAIKGWWIFHSWFLTDDFLFLADISRGVDDPSWYLRIHQGHFMPVSFGLVKLVAVLGDPFTWTAAATQILVLSVLTAFACWWMLTTLFGNRPAILVGLGFYLFAPLTMPSIMWWAVAINQLPHQIAFFGAMACHVQYCRGRRRRWLIAASFFLTLGYLSYAKTGLIVVVLAIMTVIWFSYGRPWDRVRLAVARYRWAWSLYAVISIAWLVTYLHQSPVAPATESAGFLPLAQTTIWETFLPALVGGPWNWYLFGQGPISYTDAPVLAVVVAVVVVAAVLAYSWGTRTRSLQILWAVVAYLFASALLVFSGRAYVLLLIGGSTTGRHLQYVSDIAPLIALALVALFVPVRGAFTPSVRRADPLSRIPVPRPLVAGILLVMFGGALYSSHLYAEQWRSYPERELAQKSVAEIRAERPTFADVGVAPTLLGQIFGDSALIKNYFAPLGPVLDVKKYGTDLSMFDDRADVVRAGLRDPGSSTLSADDPDAGPCLPVSSVGRWQTVTPPLSFGLWLAVDYRATSTSAPGDFAPANLTTTFGDTRATIPIAAGSHRVMMVASDPRPTVRVQADGPFRVCITSVRYGVVAPEAR